jgi:hypothetical protein
MRLLGVFVTKACDPVLTELENIAQTNDASREFFHYSLRNSAALVALARLEKS